MIMDQQQSARVKAQLLAQAEVLFRNNLQQGFNKFRDVPYRFVSPARVEYIYQWLWDTAFHAIILSHIDLEWAKAEILNNLKGQWGDGFMPHVIFWQEGHVVPRSVYFHCNPRYWRIHSTSITQPPLTASAIESIYQKDHDPEFLLQTLPHIARFHRWLLDNRDPDRDGLLAIISAKESGMDQSPVFQDAVHYAGQNPVALQVALSSPDLRNIFCAFDNHQIVRGDFFNVKELLFNCVFVNACRSLGRLFRAIGEEGEALVWLEQACKTEQAILTQCWDEQSGMFCTLSGLGKRKITIKTIASLIPLCLDGLQGEKLARTVALLTNSNEFWTPFPVPSVALSEKYYRPGMTPWYEGTLLWRGPTWINTNWFIVNGLRKHGYPNLADHMVDKMVEMVEAYGFREFYHPETGVGYRRKGFGWSTLVADLL
jgi:glycogen debranching enzyme